MTDSPVGTRSLSVDDRDGIPDLATGSNYYTTSILFGRGDGSFGPRLDLGVERMPTSIAIGDVDRDGRADIVAASESTSTVSVLLNRAPLVGVIEAPFPARIWLAPGSPNPSRGGVAVAFALPAPAQASLRVYDLAGRLVRTLASRDFAAGRHVVPWDRRSDRGIAASPGVYLCELRACGERRVGRLVLLK